MASKIQKYIDKWKNQGYKTDIPDEVPNELMNLNLAPSYKAIALAILKNDHALKTLGFDSKPSYWYNFLKKMEITSRK